MKYLILFSTLLSLLACGQPQGTVTGPAIADLRGQWVVINYWAQWCKPCIEEIPELNALDRDYPQVTVLGVNYDGASGEELESQREQLGVTFTSLIEDPAEQLGKSRPVVLPTTFIVNPEGKLAAELMGPQTLESLLQATEQTPKEAAEETAPQVKN
ncbi:Thiol-disulfide oxidoreductase ResA [Halioglobus japonicus]|nr:Thiol-disulfide oxidoreductase ResA [Halioglobus japonicus]